MKSILVAVDHTAAGQVAQQQAVELALRHGARLTGVGVLDVAAFTAREPVPIGGMSLKAERDHDLMEQEWHLLERVLGGFAGHCRSKGVEHQVLCLQDHQLDVLKREAAHHDLIVMGRDTKFNPFASEDGKVSQTVSGLLRDNPRPVLVTPPGPLCGEGLLVVHDGTPGSERLLQVIAMLGLHMGESVEILALGRDPAHAASIGESARDYLADHGIRAHVSVLDRPQGGEQAILQSTKDRQVRIVAMAGAMETGWRRLLHGTMKQRLLGRCASAVLVYH